MRRLDIGGASPSFIGCWNLDNPSLCQGIIDFFERSPSLHTSGQTTYGIDPKVKNSIDITVNPHDLKQPSHAILANYFGHLYGCYKDYLEQWPFLGTLVDALDIGQFNIQKYNAGGHFGKVHSERVCLENAHRLLAWMTYLNDVEDGGHTNFVYQGLTVKPERGKTLIWPSEWTHAHSGQVVNSGEKYIITGWIHFPAK